MTAARPQRVVETSIDLVTAGCESSVKAVCRAPQSDLDQCLYEIEAARREAFV
jgi:hypothetical protein